LLARFDDVVGAINEQEATYPIQIRGAGTLNREYTLSNGRILRAEIFSAELRKNPESRLLAGGYVGVDGGLSANVVLTGQSDAVASAQWSAVEVTVMALIAGDARLRLYREAGVSDATICYAEYMNGNEAWRRNSPSYFGFPRPELLFRHFGVHALDVYQLQTADLDQAFNQVLTVGIRMPRNM